MFDKCIFGGEHSTAKIASAAQLRKLHAAVQLEVEKLLSGTLFFSPALMNVPLFQLQIPTCLDPVKFHVSQVLESFGETRRRNYIITNPIENVIV